MTVRELKVLRLQFALYTAKLADSVMTRVYLGYGIKFEDKETVLDTILIDVFIRANQTCLDSDKVVYPVWCSKDSFDKFISKINHHVYIGSVS